MGFIYALNVRAHDHCIYTSSTTISGEDDLYFFELNKKGIKKTPT